MEDFLEMFGELHALDETFLGNTIREYLIALGIFLAAFLVFRLFRLVILKRLESMAQRSENDFDDLLAKIFCRVPQVFYWFIAFYIASQWLRFAPFYDGIIDGIFVIVVVVQAVISVQELFVYILGRYIRSKNDQGEMAFHGLTLVMKIILWSIGLLLVLSNLGFDITSLVASLGIGGVAVALAVQNILADVFSSFSIYFDKPFQVGDFVVVDANFEGTVKKIGLKTTRIEALSGEELVVSNQELTNSKVRNYRKMKKRRVEMRVGVEYGLPVKKLEKINDIVEKILTSMDDVEFGRSHFKSFGDSALIFEIIYFVDQNDYLLYMDRQQELNMKLYTAFTKEKIGFAFPTQTVHVVKG